MNTNDIYSTDEFRVQDKSNVRFRGAKTKFDIYALDPSQKAYIFAGRGFANGFDRSDAACIRAFLLDSDE
ncbi:MAG: hypothetical protein KGI54_17495 [Pseudomonadota bacterium]|nr:hypothetical protein [Pseudomonadota bacterium]